MTPGTEVWPILDGDGEEVAWARSSADAHRIAWLMGQYEEYGALDSRQHRERMRTLRIVRIAVAVMPVALVATVVAMVLVPVDVEHLVGGSFLGANITYALYGTTKVNKQIRARFEHQRKHINRRTP